MAKKKRHKVRISIVLALVPNESLCPFRLPNPRPALYAAALKERFARATPESHPDKFAQSPEAERTAAEARYTPLNQAYQTLVDPRARLLALYELTKGEKPRDIQRIPPGTMDLFKEVGELCRALDDYLARKAAATNRLERPG